MSIPIQLQNPEFRFVLLGKWNKWKNTKTKEIIEVSPERYKEFKDNPEWKPLGKAPFEKKWQENGYDFNNQKLLSHIQNGGNFGVIGGYGNLIILDKDNEKLDIDFDTFCIKTGSGGKHYYLFSDYNTNNVFINEFGELRANNYQVVCANCTHPNGNKYEIYKDLPIKKISKEELITIIKPYLREEIPTMITLNNFEKKDTSRSGLEYRKILALLRKGKTKEEIFQEMMAYAKWSSSIEQYKEFTYNKALAFIKNEDKTKVNVENKEQLKQIINNFENKIDLVQQLLQIQPIHYDENRVWWIWNKSKLKWQVSDDTSILNFVRELSFANTIQAKEKQEIIEAIKQESRLRKPEPIKKTWIQFVNKIVDIETGEEMDVSPKYFVTNPIPYKLHPDRFVNTPTMDRIFEEWVGKEYVKTLYEIIAYCLVPDYPIHRLFCLIGAGLNGKGCFLRLLKKFIGEDNITSTELDVLLNSRFEVTRLHKKLVCMMGETNFNEMRQTSILKKLTGQDLIGFEYKNKNPFTDDNYAKIIIATNNLPTTTDKTIGFYRRWMIVDFPNRFSEAKDILSEIPEEEYEALAVKSLIILKDLLDKRAFTNEGSIEERTDRYEAKSNFLDKFLSLFVEENLDGYITKASFINKFKDWSKENKHREMSETSIGLEMKKRGYETSRKSFDWMNDGRGGQARVWLGIKWRE